MHWWAELFRRTWSTRPMGIALSNASLQAGLSLPQMHIEGLVVHGPDWNRYDSVVEGPLCSAFPLMIQLGITTSEEANIDTFAERLRTETLNQGSVIVAPLLIEAWTRTTC